MIPSAGPVVILSTVSDKPMLYRISPSKHSIKWRVIS